MDNDSKFDSHILSELSRLEKMGIMSSKYREIVEQFYDCLKEALLEKKRPFAPFAIQFSTFLQLIEQQFQSPYTFQPYHRKIRAPLDYYRFGVEFIRPFVDLDRSEVFGVDIINQIERQINQKENVILFANHQTEPDPQAISILLEQTHPHLAEQIIYVAGDRVVTDPLAIPFSMGCDLLCIYSKRYIDYPPELREKKQLHNKQTAELMSRLLAEGGKVIYVAPSGGRDRRNPQGVIEIAPLDPKSIEMFYLMARKAKTPTHFYPLTLLTYDLMPPPATIQKELGELRFARFTPIYLSFSPEFEMENFPGAEESNKAIRREQRAQKIWTIIHREHTRLMERLLLQT